MKKTLSTLVFFMLLGVISVTAQCCQSSADNSDEKAMAMVNKSAEVSDVSVYYFHLTRRCFTCKSVEKNVRKAVKDLYGDDVSFSAVNWQENKEHEVIQKHNVRGQSLLITNGEDAEELTSFAFMNARNPEKLKNKIKETVESL